MNPKDWKNRSEIKLPWKPNKFLISVSLGKIKLGSSGEYEKSAINKRIPAEKIMIPDISANRFKVKLSNKLAVFLMSIYTNQLYHFVSSNFCC